MNQNDKEFLVQKIRAEYTENEEKKNTDLEALKELDKEVRRPANIFAYTFGIIAALIMGSGMSLIMTDIGARLGNVMVPGIIIGVVGLFMALINYPIYNKILKGRRKKYADKIIELSDKIMEEK